MFRFYRVGGCVRDSLLGHSTKDIDQVAVWQGEPAPTSEVFDHFVAFLKDRGVEPFEIRPEYVTLRGRDPGGQVADFVLARRDGVYNDRRRPDEIALGTLEEDLARRDFTVNALAEDPETGQIIDLFGGRIHLKNRVLVCVGDPDARFSEDGLRILRAVRFAVTKEMKIAPLTAQAMARCRDALSAVSVERIREELLRAFRANALRTVKLLEEHGLWGYTLRGGLWLKPTLESC